MVEHKPGRRAMLRASLGIAALGGAAAGCAPPIEAKAKADEYGAWRFQARTIPVPQSISPEARHFLTWKRPAMGPGPQGAEAWRKELAQSQAGAVPYAEGLLKRADVPIETQALQEGAALYIATPRDLPAARKNRAIVSLHGGGLLYGAGLACKAEAADLAHKTGHIVFGVDYRTGPDHPFPAALDDCVRGYGAALQKFTSKGIIISGASAGGNLAAASVLKARDSGMALPAGVVLLTPEIDLTESGDSFVTNRYLDVVLGKGLAESIAVYAGGHDLHDPYVSPLFADFSAGFPPTFLQTGTRDIFLSNTVRMHRALRRAHVEAQLHVWEAMPHAGFGGVSPEDGELAAEIALFMEKCWAEA